MADSRREEIETAKKRCVALSDRIHLHLSSSSNSKKRVLSDSCKQTLLRLVNSELKFLSRLPSQGFDDFKISVNIGYLESVVYILQQPFIGGVSRVCKSIPLSSEYEKKGDSHSKGVHIDIVCTLDRSPVWFIVSDRNPKYISWSESHKNKGLKSRIEKVLAAALSSSTLKPALIVMFFSHGLDDVICKKLVDEFGASEFGTVFSLVDSEFCEELDGGWVNLISRSYQMARAFQIKVDRLGIEDFSLCEKLSDHYIPQSRSVLHRSQTQSILGDGFCTLLSRMKLVPLQLDAAKPSVLLGEEMVNFDTTALIALVSGISNGAAENLLTAPEDEMRNRFKGNFEFVIAQVMSELEDPILGGLTCLLSEKIGMICESVRLEFKELVSMCGGTNEKLRADRLLECFWVVPDSPSTRLMGLPTTRKIALKNKIVFGTGDYWLAPTLTANMGFVRAISQTGMSLLTLEHRPRALTGD
ncbi:hypothetical protein GIB67_003575 [Kingdonia uniflora]|uniref:DUF1308 domain-containing protein n=1 Tax=Kingdonia uniflora TaxID=39325 RepID=A0A7J7MER2_9MAGN|nr:hypothetical protein GIB67_003575 [Kingdonia uniflora]